MNTIIVNQLSTKDLSCQSCYKNKATHHYHNSGASPSTSFLCDTCLTEMFRLHYQYLSTLEKETKHASHHLQ